METEGQWRITVYVVEDKRTNVWRGGLSNESHCIWRREENGVAPSMLFRKRKKKASLPM